MTTKRYSITVELVVDTSASILSADTKYHHMDVENAVSAALYELDDVTVVDVSAFEAQTR